MTAVSATINILVGEVNDIEAHVYACVRADLGIGENDSPDVEITGTLRGPFCESSRTLPALFPFRELKAPPPRSALPESEIGCQARAEAIVPDPCLWSPELPHVYVADLVAKLGGRAIAEFHGSIGLRRLTPRREGIAFPG